MSGTRAGAIKTSATNRERYGQDFYRRIGQIGGRNGHTGGFASNPELARVAGRKGGTISRRGKARPIMRSTHESTTRICGRAFKDGDQIHLPTIQYLVCECKDSTEVMGSAWWYYHYQGHKFRVCFDTDPKVPLEDSYRKLPPEASVADIEQARDEIADAVWSHYKDIPLAKRAPQYLPVERTTTKDGYIYRLVGAQGNTWFKVSNKLEME